MHPALGIPEITSLICDLLRCDHAIKKLNPQLQVEDHRCDASRALFAFSLTGKCVSDAALDALWYRIYNLQPLVKCMGRDIWTDAVGVNDGRIPLGFSRALLPPDVNVLKRCASRIREYTQVLPTKETSFDCSILRTIDKALWSEGPLLPNVKKLQFQGYGFMDFARLLIPRNLESLSIYLTGSQISTYHPILVEFGPELASWLANTPLKLLNLRDLMVVGYSPGDSTRVVSDAVCRFTSLTALKCSYLTPKALWRLGVIETLQDLEFAFEKTNPDPWHLIDTTKTTPDAPIKMGSRDHAFSSLRRLHIKEADLNMQLLGDFITTLKDNHTLQSFRCDFEYAGTPPSQWLEVLSLIAAKFPNGLQSLTIGSNAKFGLLWSTYNRPMQFRQTYSHDYIVSKQVPSVFLGHLLTFRSLRYIHFRHPDGFDITDRDTDALASALPDLQECVLDTTCRPPDEFIPRVTLASLASFATHSTRLTVLALTLDARAEHIPSPCFAVEPSRIRQLDLGYSILDFPQAVAEYILSIAPLADLTYHGDGCRRSSITHRTTSWYEVQNLLITHRYGH